MIGQEWDAVVIGGGPAGCSAATILARQGLRVGLIEAGAYPKEKVCGEFLSPECGPILDGLLAEHRGVNARGTTLRQVRITAPGGAIWESPMPAPAISLSRGALDLALAEAAQRAGAQLMERTRVVALAGNLDFGFELGLQTRHGSQHVRARAVIGAHGRRDRLDRQLHRAFMRSDQPFMAFKAHFTGPSLQDRIELHAFPGGYCGLSDIEEGRQNVCMLVHRSAFAAANAGRAASVDHLLEWIGRQNAALGGWLQQAGRPASRWLSIAQIPFGRKIPLEGDVLMVGDAAGVIAPLAGDGIAIALESGALAGKLVVETLIGLRTIRSLQKEYPAAWRRMVHRRLQWGRFLQPLLLNPTAADAVIRLLAAAPYLGQFFIRSTRGEIPETRGTGPVSNLPIQEDR